MKNKTTKRNMFLTYLLMMILLFVGLYSALLKLKGNIFLIEALFVFISLIISVIILKGIMSKKRWVASMSIIFFSVQLLNIINLYVSLGISRVIIALLISVIGLLLSIKYSSPRERQLSLKPYYDKNKGKVVKQSRPTSKTAKSASKKTKKSKTKKTNTKRKSNSKNTKKKSKSSKKKSSKKKTKKTGVVQFF